MLHIWIESCRYSNKKACTASHYRGYLTYITALTFTLTEEITLADLRTYCGVIYYLGQGRSEVFYREWSCSSFFFVCADADKSTVSVVVKNSVCITMPDNPLLLFGTSEVIIMQFFVFLLLCRLMVLQWWDLRQMHVLLCFGGEKVLEVGVYDLRSYNSLIVVHCALIYALVSLNCCLYCYRRFQLVANENVIVLYLF